MMESPRPKGDNNSEKSLRNEICIRLICARPTGANFTTPPRTKYPASFSFGFMETDLIRQLKYFPYLKLLNYKFRFKWGGARRKLYLYRVGCMHQVNEDKALSGDLISASGSVVTAKPFY